MTTVQEARQALVAALRSGEFEQGRQKLRGDDDTYCCLGVACAVYQKLTGRGRWDGEYVHRYAFCVDREANTTELPSAVQAFFGFKTPVGVYEQAAPSGSLICDNDQRVPFTVIADTIEREPEGLFEEAA